MSGEKGQRLNTAFRSKAALEEPGGLFRLDGKVALITGAHAGLGRAIASAFSASGARVGVHARDDRAEQAAKEIPGAVPAIFDLAEGASVRDGLSRFVSQLGVPDILVCNAAMRDRRSLLNVSTDDFREMVEVNVLAHFDMIRMFIPTMIEKRGGNIILITSSVIDRAVPTGSTYAASKAALEALTRSLAVELSQHNIRVNAIRPGMFGTEYNADLTRNSAVLAKIENSVPLRRYGLPSEIIGPALFLASEASSYVTGHTLVVDGGATIQA